MPEPLLYGKAMIAAALASAVCVLAVVGARRPASTARANLACGLGIVLGLMLGYYVLGVRPAWPPASGLDRLLLVVLPVALGVELLAGWDRTPRWSVWLLRLSLCAAAGMILLHGSVYVSAARREWSTGQAVITLASCGALLAALWALLWWLSQRSPGVSLPLSLALSIQCGGAAIMLAGYLQGGAAAFPLAAAVAAGALASRGAKEHASAPVLIGVGVVGLFGLLFIGRYFGNLSTSRGLGLLLAPLLCWATELPTLRRQKPWLVGTLRLFLVAIPLVVALVLAKREFDRKMGPLLMQAPGAPVARAAA